MDIRPWTGFLDDMGVGDDVRRRIGLPVVMVKLPFVTDRMSVVFALARPEYLCGRAPVLGVFPKCNNRLLQAARH